MARAVAHPCVARAAGPGDAPSDAPGAGLDPTLPDSAEELEIYVEQLRIEHQVARGGGPRYAHAPTTPHAAWAGRTCTRRLAR